MQNDLDVKIIYQFLEKYEPAISLEEATLTLSPAEISAMTGLSIGSVSKYMSENDYRLENLGGTGILEYLLKSV